MHVAVDLGAESGRVVRGCVERDRLVATEVLRFPNQPVQTADRLAWNIEGLLGAVRAGIDAAGPARSVGIDSWAVDFALLRADGTLVAPPRAYRDPITAGILPELFARVPPERLYEITGIQMMEINTICQLLALRLANAPELAAAERLMLLPDYLLHQLGADPAAERTNASTTQLLVAGGAWSSELLAAIPIDGSLLPPLVPAGTRLGTLGAAELIAVATHDTASAVVAVPFEPGEPAAFVSSGTWSLVGLELPAPVLTEKARAHNLSNEEGYARTTRLLRNVMGLWLAQRCVAAWGLSADEGVRLAETGRPRSALFDPDDPSLLRADDMPAAIARLARVSPDDRATLLRGVFESLALRYRAVIDALRDVTGAKVERVHVVGGGARNRLLCQLTADAVGVPVLAGPVEATALGNLVVQMIALGELRDVGEARALIRRSTDIAVYEPSTMTVGGR